MYVTLKLDDNGCCRIHSISDDGNGWIVANERYVVMPWKMVTRYGKNMTLTEAVDGIISHQESEAKECERREREKEEIEKKHKEYYEAHLKEEMERLNKLVDWYKFKLDEIRETPIDSRPRKLSRLYRYSETNKDSGVTITRARTLNLVNYPGYPPELKSHEYEDNEEDVFCDAPKPGSLLLDVNHVINSIISKRSLELIRGEMKVLLNMLKKVEALIDKPLDKMMESLGSLGPSGPIELEDIRLAMAKVKCPCKLDISVFYQLTRRLPHEGLDYDDERLLIHFYNTFYNESIKLLGCTVRHRVTVLYHLLDKIGKEPNADLFQFMKRPSHE